MPLEPATRPRAVIDIGSNAVRLVVFEGLPPNHRRLLDDTVSCGLGRDFARGCLPPGSRALKLKAIDGFLGAARRVAADPPALLATAALRERGEGSGFVREIERRFALPVRVLSGADEARLAALGIASGMPHAVGTVADLAGAGLELVELAAGRTGRSASLPLGHLRLFHRWGGTLESADRAIGSALAKVPWLASMRGRTLYVTCGSWRSIGRRRIAAAANAAATDGFALVRGEAQVLAGRMIAELERRHAAGRPGSPGARFTLAIAALAFARLLERGEPATAVFSTRGIADGWLLAERVAAADPPVAP